MKRRDPVTPELRIAVFERDRGCVVPLLDSTADECRGRLTIEHVRDSAAMGGRRAPSDMRHCLSLCFHHHLDGWASAHKPLERQWLARVAPTEEAARW